MVRVAVAGGTGGLGRTLVEELVKSNKHEVFIFSRKVGRSPPGIPLIRMRGQSIIELQLLLAF